MVDEQRFPFSFSRYLRPLFWLLGTGPGRSDVVIDGDALTVRLGRLFTCEVPLDQIVEARPGRTTWLAVGAHTNLRGRWIINADVGPAVDFSVAPPVRGRTLGISVSVKRLTIGVAEPDALLAALTND